MQFKVPQFIEVEDQIFGPLTFKQFVYLLGGGALVFLLYRFLPFFFAILFILPIIAFSLALAFYKVNNRPFIYSMEAAIKFFFQRKLYIWKKRTPQKREAVAKKEEPLPSMLIPKLSDSKLKELSWSLDINDSLYAGYDEENRQNP